jgi:hypothetical protein
MKPQLKLLCALAGLLALVPAIQAQSAKSTRSSSFSYDVSEEVSVSGSVTGVLTRAGTGMVNGSHLLIATPAGTMDVSLGPYGLVGKGALSAQLGSPVEITGVMKMFGGKPVLLARTVTFEDRMYRIRTEHGVALSPMARERAENASAENGGAR